MVTHKNPHDNAQRTGKKNRNSRAKTSERANRDILYGVHTVLEALNNPDRQILRLLMTENAAHRYRERVQGIIVKHENVAIEEAKPGEISQITGPEAVHQGLVLLSRPLPEPDLQSIAEHGGPVVMLDQITDPHNVGAIIRSAAAFNAAGVVMTARNSPQLSGVLAKSASGGLEHVPIAKVTNLSKAIRQLADAGVSCIGLDSEANNTLEEIVGGTQERHAIVLGAEGKGLRHLTRETCTALARLDMPGAIASLNVSNAAALALYAMTRSS